MASQVRTNLCFLFFFYEGEGEAKGEGKGKEGGKDLEQASWENTEYLI